MAWDDGLTGPHRNIAGSTASRIAVLAGPGTGKTSYGLMRRMSRLLGEGVDPKRILLLSFTRVAAADLRDKVEASEAPGAGDVRAFTLHSYCLGVLQSDAVLAQTRRNPRILLKHEGDLMLRDLSGDFGDVRERRAQLKAFEAGWARGTTDHPGLPVDPEDRAFEAEVLRWLVDHKAILIGEVVPLAYDYLRHNPLASELNDFDHVIVDEYQDLNTLEQKLLELLSESAQLCIAGDDDQSIYSMRYANPDGIVEFAEREGVEKHEIVVCGRCPRLVLDLANSLIGCSPVARSKGNLQSNHPDEGQVDIIQWPTLDEEIDGAIAAIAAEIGTGAYAPGEILVLAHRRLIGERIRDGLRALEMPVETFFSEEELDTQQAQEAMALLQLAVDPDDLPALRVVLGIGDDQGRSSAYVKVWHAARAAGISPRELMERIASGDNVALRVPALVRQYMRALEIIADLDVDDLKTLVDKLFPETVTEVLGLRSVALEAFPHVANANQLLGQLIRVITQDEVPQHPTYVRIMSLHKSKGLTSPRVYVLGLVEGIVPTYGNRAGAALEDAINEQRRLVYVAITRTAKRLTLSCCAEMDFRVAAAFGALVRKGSVRRRGGGHTCDVIASRYFRELGPRAPRAVPGVGWLEQFVGSDEGVTNGETRR